MTIGTEPAFRSAEPADREPLLSIRSLSKSFGGTKALDGVTFDVRPGEVHGLVGENGSGKSTLIKVLSGFHVPEPGSAIEVSGREVSLPLSAAQLQEMGLRFVHQDLGLAPTLTVAENLFVDELSTDPSWLLRASVQRRRARERLSPFGRPLDPSAKVGSLSAADQAHVAIVRAVSQLRQHQSLASSFPGILVLDEVTAFLPSAGRAQLFELIREVVAQGDSVLFVSHYLDEVLEITSRVSVLRDGRLVSTLKTSEIDSDGLVELIIGRSLGGGLPGSQQKPGRDDDGVERAATVVSGLSGRLVQDIDFVVHEGEVLGVTGLLGSGFEELPALLFGAESASSGRLQLGDRQFDLTDHDPQRATAAGIAFVPEDRHSAGGAGSLTVEENLTLRILPGYEKRGAVSRRRLTRAASALLEDYDVRPRDPKAPMSTLSGGNQQKVIMAKWLAMEPSLLLLHEPTHGVDVGSRDQILRRIRAAASDGMAVVCASSDPEQLSELCDRVLVLARGRVVAELAGQELDKNTIVERSYQTSTTPRSADALGVSSS